MSGTELRKAVAAAIFDPGATEGFKGDRTLTEWQTDAVMRALSAVGQKAGTVEAEPVAFGFVQPETADLLAKYGGAPIRAERDASTGYSVPVYTRLSEPVACQRCQGNGEIVTDWERYMHARPGDKGDEAVAECPDCCGTGTHPVPSPIDYTEARDPICRMCATQEHGSPRLPEECRCGDYPAVPDGLEALVKRTLPSYGSISFDALGRDVREAQIGHRDDYEFDPSYHKGHQIVSGINFNSLNRIVSKYANAIAALIAERDEARRLVDGIDEERRGALDLCIERNKQIQALEADRAANAARIERLETALKNLAYEMRFLLNNHPKYDGGLYRRRLNEAEAALGVCVHRCDEGGICLAEHAGFPESCPTAACSTLEGK